MKAEKESLTKPLPPKKLEKMVGNYLGGTAHYIFTELRKLGRKPLEAFEETFEWYLRNGDPRIQGAGRYLGAVVT